MTGDCRDVLPYPSARKRDCIRATDPDAQLCQHDLGIATIEAWPAAGGGLLLGAAESGFAGKGLLRPAIKTIFIRLDPADEIVLTLPYVTLEEEAAGCLQMIVAQGLAVAESHVLMLPNASCLAYPTVPSTLPRIADIGPQAELTVEVCAATARQMLIAAAAEMWALPEIACHASGGMIQGAMPDQVVCYGGVATRAGWLQLPDSVCLCSGQSVDLSPMPRGRYRQVAIQRSRRYDGVADT